MTAPVAPPPVAPPRPDGRGPHPVAAYGVPAAGVALAAAVRLALAGLIDHVFVFFYPVVALAALYAGRGPALVATGLSVVAAGLVMAAPHGLRIDPPDLLGLAIFAVVNAAVVVAVDRFRRTQLRLEALERAAALREAESRLVEAEAGQRRSEAAASLSRAQLEAVVNAMSDGVIVVDAERRPVLVNEALTRFTGFPGARALGADLELVRRHYRVETLDGRPVPSDQWPMSRAMRGESVPSTELKARREDLGQEWYFGFACEPVRDESGRQVLTVGVARDISGRVAAEVALRRQADLQVRMAAVAAAVPGCLYTVLMAPGTPPVFGFVSPAAGEVFGMSPEELVRDPALGMSRVHPHDLAEVLRGIEEAGRTLAPWHSEYRYLHPTKGARWLEAHAVPVRGPAGGVTFHGFTTDVTDRREAQEAVRALAARLQAAREDEASRIARDLHDDLGQTLTALQLELRWIEERVERLPPSLEAGPLVDRVVAAAELAAATLTTVQRLSQGLHPAALDHLGLAAAVRQELRRFSQRAGLEVTTALEADLPPGDATGKALYRIFLEAITNVARHAGALHVEVRLWRDAGGLGLSVSDDGRGLPPGLAATPATLGLLGMQERAHALGGEVRFSAGERGGTVVTARIPPPAGGQGA